VSVVHLTDANFQAEVLEAPAPVLVDVWAEWCGPCRLMAPLMEWAASTYAGRLSVAKLEADPKIFELFIEASIRGRGVARKHRLKLQSEVRSVLEDGMASGAFPAHDIRRALALVFDISHRFLSPPAIRVDGEVTRAQIDGRFERVLRALRRTLGSGVL
jgi:thiol-disulfide isomerase/thioredoxin